MLKLKLKPLQARQRNRFVFRLSLGRIQRFSWDGLAVRRSVKRKRFGRRGKEAEMEIRILSR